MILNLKNIPEKTAFDVVVIGAGGAGMSAALFAAIDGAKVLLVESTEYVGGTTAYSAGTTWIVNTPEGLSVNKSDTIADAKTFLNAAVGSYAPEAMREAFVNNGYKAVAHIQANSDVKYVVRPTHPDYISDLPGSVMRGRAIEPISFDGRLLGENFKYIRPPIPEFTVLGGMMVDRDDIGHLLKLTKSFKSFVYSTKIILRHGLDRLKYSRGTRLVMGNALIARLLYSLLKKGVSIVVSTKLEDIVVENDQVKSIIVSQGDDRKEIIVNRSVILASGGFNRHPTRRQEMLPGISPDWCPAAPGHKGAAHDIVLKKGATYGEGAMSNAFWAPVSIRRRADGSTAAFPHFIMDRGKPGMLTVNQKGERFLNESTSYHLFGVAMQAANKTTPSIPAYLVCDAEAIKKYGLGMVRPGGKGFDAFIKEGYLKEGATIAELAGKLNVDTAVLEKTISEFNQYARDGVDPIFNRGTTDYQRFNGDATRGTANPCLGELKVGPFYAVQLYPGDIGAATGLVTNDKAQVLNKDKAVINGLYAVGNDMQSVMGGTYPGPGITIGPGLTFAYIAAKTSLGKPL
jgi:succinate dehydrogenase/fumarate reductase flavoprotein subunit